VKKYTVIIPTTNNVIGINDIVKEDPLVSSVICENNNLEALPISPFYNSFVKSPTGIIEKLVGHSSFRTDITKPIHNGKSWQLAIAIAHIFLKNNILNFSNENQLLTKKTEEIIWASGTINSNLEIKKINYLDQKIYNSMSFFKNCIKKEVQINIILSIQNRDNFNSLVSNNEFLKNAIKNKLIKVLFFKNLYGLFDHLNLKNILKKPIKRLSFLQKSKKTLSILSIIFVSILFALIFNSIWQKTSPLLSLNDNKNYSLLLTTLKTYRYGNLTERVIAYFYDYIQTIQSNEINKKIRLNFIPYNNLESNKLKCLQSNQSIDYVCDLNLEVSNIGKETVFLWALKFSNLDLKEKASQKTNKKSDIVNGMIKSNEAYLIDIKNSQEPITLFIVYSKEFDIKIIDWLKRVDREKSLLETTIKRIKALGYGYTITSIKNVKLIENKI
jgi:hypothetical protein